MSDAVGSATGALIGTTAVLAALVFVWRFRPTRWILRRLAVAFVSPAREKAEEIARDIVREETDDIRRQVFDNGNGSLADRLGRIEQGQQETRERGLDLSARFAALEQRLAETDPP